MRALPRLLVLVALLALAPSAKAGFCEAPYAALCGDPPATKEQRDQRLEDLRKQLGADGLKQRIDELESGIVKASVPTVKEYLKKAIDEQSGLGFFSADTAREMKDRIDATQVFTRKDLDVPDSRVPWLNFQVLNYMMTCGPDGTADNAYSATKESTPFILLCPGWLLRAGGDVNDARANFRNILQVLAHELGHKIDASKYPDVFKQYEVCLSLRYPKLLEYRKKDVDALLAKLPPETRVFTSYYRVHNHIDEITADFWGAQTVRHYLAEHSDDEKLDVLREAWAGLCETGDEGTHPDGNYRIEILLRADPQIEQLMGCAADPVSSCTLAGFTH